MGFELVSRSAKRVYEEKRFVGEGVPLNDVLFPIVDTDLNADFMLDQYIHDPYGVSYREPGSQAIVRQFKNGSSLLVKPPMASEKTPIDSELKDLALFGGEVTEDYLTRLDRLVSLITTDHVEGHKMIMLKQALDVVRTGVFPAKGEGGKSIGLDIDFGRDAANDLTYDFTADGASFAEALVNVQTQAIDQSAPLSGFVAILGENWIKQFDADSGIQTYLQASAATAILESKMMPDRLSNAQGLIVLGRIRTLGMRAPMWICALDLGSQYVPYKGASPESWIPDDDAVFFSLNDERYTINRGIDVKNANGTSERVAGEVAFDTYTSDDPVIDYLRSSRRGCYVPANVDHTFKSTGTFS